ncbi:MAG: hypothetical protein QMD14_05885 [Candidatus Aenigmarchaeota archaeon]|nr:hypothetical protein [Candidatus Aenigmarchaeota archaeon]
MEKPLREAISKLNKYSRPGITLYTGDSAYPIETRTETVAELKGSLGVLEYFGVEHQNIQKAYRAIEEFENIRGFRKRKERERKTDEIRSYLLPIIAAAEKLLYQMEKSEEINEFQKRVEDLQKHAADLKANFEQKLQDQKEKYENELKKKADEIDSLEKEYKSELTKKADEIESLRKKYENELKEKADEIESLKKQLSGKFEAIPQPEWKPLFRVTELGYLVATDAKVKDVLPKIKMYGEDLRASGDEENYGSDLLRLYRFLDGKGLSPDRGIRDVTGATEDLKRMREELEKLLSAAIEYYKGRVGESL